MRKTKKFQVMSTIDNYPPGAAHDSSAPYNEREIPKRDFDCKVSFVISKKMPIACFLVEC
jgi:hypothetical protein